MLVPGDCSLSTRTGPTCRRVYLLPENDAEAPSVEFGNQCNTEFSLFCDINLGLPMKMLSLQLVSLGAHQQKRICSYAFFFFY